MLPDVSKPSGMLEEWSPVFASQRADPEKDTKWAHGSNKISDRKSMWLNGCGWMNAVVILKKQYLSTDSLINLML